MKSGNIFSRIEQIVLIECVLDVQEGLDLVRAELYTHLIDLLDANAMLTGNRATHLHAFHKHFSREFFSASKLVRIVGVEQDQGMKVAISGMEYVWTAQSILLFHLRDVSQYLAKPSARYRAIHTVVIRRDSPDRGKRGLAPGPETHPFRLIFRYPQPARSRCRKNLLHARDLLLHLLFRAIRFTQQYGVGVQVVSGMYEFLDRARSWSIHQFQPRRNDA